jgi:hypothetical protein
MEVLPAKIKSNRLRCTHCHAPATDIGTCPYCHTQIKRKKLELKPKNEYRIVKKKGIDKGEFTRVLKVNNDVVNSFFSNFGTDYKIDFGASIQIRFKSEINEEEAAVMGSGSKTYVLFKIIRSEPCECGCHDIAADYERGETFCPKCGLVHENLKILNHGEGLL